MGEPIKMDLLEPYVRRSEFSKHSKELTSVDKMVLTNNDPQLVFYAMMRVLTDKDWQRQAIETFYYEI